MLSAALGVARIKYCVRELILVAGAVGYSLMDCGTVIRRFSQFLFAQRKLVEYHNDSVALLEPHSLLTETIALPAGCIYLRLPNKLALHATSYYFRAISFLGFMQACTVTTKCSGNQRQL
jgi:hypothetical protein